jgi:hypothetical protein
VSLLGQSAADGLAANIPEWSAWGGVGAFFVFLFKRWNKQRDDAYQAAIDAEARVTAQYDARMDALKKEYDARIATLVEQSAARDHRAALDMQELRTALSQVVNALVSEPFGSEERTRLQRSVLTVLFEHGQAGHHDPHA